MTEKEICKRFYKHLIDNHIVEEPFNEDCFEEYIYLNYKGDHSDKNSLMSNVISESDNFKQLKSFTKNIKPILQEIVNMRSNER
jgi:hypothetical protein